jgi:uncharacterized protein (TIGR00369 family)
MLSPDLDSTIRARINQVPIIGMLAMEIIALDEGYCEARTPRRPEYDGIFASMHGGLLMTVADTVACWAVLTGAGADARLATTDMNIRFLAPCLTDVTAKARVIKFGRTLCPVAVDLFDASGVHVAVAGVNYILLR